MTKEDIDKCKDHFKGIVRIMWEAGLSPKDVEKMIAVIGISAMGEFMMEALNNESPGLPDGSAPSDF